MVRRVKVYAKRATTATRRYVGPVVCPRCGRRGHLNRTIRTNLRTGAICEAYSVLHSTGRREDGKVRRVNLGTCYLGSPKKTVEEYGLTIPESPSRPEAPRQTADPTDRT